MPRAIVHLDADAFFASVEQAADPKLRGKAVAVGGEKRGIIASASYEARRFGVFTPMPTARARKLCPRLIVLPGDFDKYDHFSRWMFSYAQDFTPDVEIASIDEGYFDLSAVPRPPLHVAETIRAAIRQALKISVSEGIGSNKLVSQIASKLTKPAAFQAVPAGQEIAFLHPLANKWLPGVGPKTSAQLTAAGLAQVRHIAAMPLELLELLLGKQASGLRQFARGIDERPLVPARAPQKSFSQQETFPADLTDEEYIEATLRRMADHLFASVRAEGGSIRTLTVRVRYNDMGEDLVSESLIEPTDLETDVYGRLRTMLRRAWKRRVSLRLVSLKLSNLYDGRFAAELPLEVTVQRQAGRAKLARVIDELRQAHGHAVILRGHDFVLKDESRSRKAEGRRKKAEIQHATSNTERSISEVSSDRLDVERSRLNVGCCRFMGSFHDSGIAHWDPEPHREAAGARLCEPQHVGRVHGGVGPRDAVPTRGLLGGFVPLRARSHYSFLDSMLSPTAIVDLAKQQGLSAVALMDLGNLHGAVEFVQAAQRAGVKPILGAELRVDNKPLLLCVESARGYHNLCRLLSQKAECRMQNEETAVAARQRASIPSSFFLLPSSFLEGLIAVSDDAHLAELFPGRFYRLVTAREVPEDFPAVAAPAIHYATPGDRQKYDILQSIRTLTLLRQEHAEKQAGGRRHFRTAAEMGAGCRGHPQWLRHTLEIAERCHFELPFGQPQFPAFHPPDGSRPSEFLRRLVLSGAR